LLAFPPFPLDLLPLVGEEDGEKVVVGADDTDGAEDGETVEVGANDSVGAPVGGKVLLFLDFFADL